MPFILFLIFLFLLAFFPFRYWWDFILFSFLILPHISASQIYGFYVHAKTKMIPDAESTVVNPILSAQKKSILYAALLSLVIYTVLFRRAFLWLTMAWYPASNSEMYRLAFLASNSEMHRLAFRAFFCSYVVISLVLTTRSTFVLLKERLGEPHRKDIKKWTAVYVVFSILGIIVFPLILAGIASLLTNF